MSVSQPFVTMAPSQKPHKAHHQTKMSQKVYMLNPNSHSQHDYLFVFSVILPLVEERMIVLPVTTPAHSEYPSVTNGSFSTPH